MQLRHAFLLLLLVSMLVSCQQEQIEKWTQERTLQSGYYPLKATHHIFPEPGGSAGDIAYINGKWLIAAGDGSFHLFQRLEGDDDFHIQPLPYRAPMNREQFSEQALKYDKKKDQATLTFRVTDLLLNTTDNGDLTLWLAHHWWNEQSGCFTLRVSTAQARTEKFLQGQAGELRWSTLFEAAPCLQTGNLGFIGLESGGKLLWSADSPNDLYLTTGIHGFNGLHGNADYAQNPDTDWGKVLRIDLDSGQHSIFSRGHRNPQGIVRDQNGQLWLTEHGPQGGDELNRLSEGSNYGWPLVTYGTEYGSFGPWPLTTTPGRHDGFPAPAYAWLPSIGVSDVIQLRGELFPRWKNDFMAVSLREQSMHRIHLEQDRVVLVEPISVGKRLRSISQSPSGEIVLWTDNHRLIFIEPAEKPEPTE